MMAFTSEAQERLDKYLNEAKAYLEACPAVNSAEVRRDIMEHIETELAQP